MTIVFKSIDIKLNKSAFEIILSAHILLLDIKMYFSEYEISRITDSEFNNNTYKSTTRGIKMM